MDAGRAKQKLLEEGHTGMARFEVRWISKASAEQRAGRAGRTGPGHCYRWVQSQAAECSRNKLSLNCSACRQADILVVSWLSIVLPSKHVAVFGMEWNGAAISR